MNFSATFRPKLQSLPFVSAKPDGSISSMWSVAPTGDWAEDNKIGREYAKQVIQFIAEANSPGTMYQIAKAMKSSAESCGIAVGFWSYIASRAAASAFALIATIPFGLWMTAKECADCLLATVA